MFLSHYFSIDLRFLLSYTIIGRLFEFVIGIYSAKMILNNNVNPKYLFSIGIVGVTSSLLLLATLQTSTNYGDYSFYGVFINNVYLPIIGIAPILLNLSRHQSTSSMILGSKFFTSLGKASYLFYLLHIGFTKKIYFQYDNNIFFYFVVMNVLCIVLFYKVEEPLTLKIKAFLKL